jgi:hypothetical protein
MVDARKRPIADINYFGRPIELCPEARADPICNPPGRPIAVVASQQNLNMGFLYDSSSHNFCFLVAVSRHGLAQADGIGFA